MGPLVGPTSYFKFRVFYNSAVQFESDKISKLYLFVLFGGGYVTVVLGERK